MSIERAMKTAGWMAPAELEWLSIQAQSHRRIIEIGSYYGRSTLALADNMANGDVLLAVDDWRGPRDIIIPWKEREAIHEKFCQNLKEHIDSGRVVQWKTKHEDMSVDRIPVQPPFDMAFIDGDHKYEAVVQHIKFAISILRDGGLLCGHDYELSWPTVMLAVCESVGEPGNVPNTNIWWVEKHVA